MNNKLSCYLFYILTNCIIKTNKMNCVKSDGTAQPCILSILIRNYVTECRKNEFIVTHSHGRESCDFRGTKMVDTFQKILDSGNTLIFPLLLVLFAWSLKQMPQNSYRNMPILSEFGQRSSLKAINEQTQQAIDQIIYDF